MIFAEAAALQPSSQLRVFPMDFKADARWEAFVNSHPDALIYHHPDWLSALEREYEQKCVGLGCEDGNGELRAILPLFYTRGLPLKLVRNATGRRLSSLPRTPVAGPLALDQVAAEEIIRHAVRLAQEQKGVQLEIKTFMERLDSVDEIACVPWRPTYVEELPTAVEGEPWQRFWEGVRLPRTCGSCKGCRRLRFGNAKQQHRVNWAVNKAIKLGLEVRAADSESDLSQWYGLYLKTMRHNGIPPRSYRFFLSLWSSMHAAGRLQLLIAEQDVGGQKRMVAGSILLNFGQTAFYAFTGCAPEDFCLHPHDIIQIESIRAACKAGFRWYDFGEVAEDHEALVQFKTKWGSEPKPLFRYYYPPIRQNETGGASTTVARLRRRVWQKLPLKITEKLGDLVYARL